MTRAILGFIFGLCCDETYGVMTNYNHGAGSRNNDRNEYIKDNDNAVLGSGSDGPIFNPITMHLPCGGGLGGNDDGNATTDHYVSTTWTIYLPY